MILDSPNRSIVAILGAVKTTTDGGIVSTVTDNIQEKITPQLILKKSNGNVEVTVVPAPAKSTAREVNEITYQNADTVDQTIYISVKDNGVYYPVVTMLVPKGRTLQFEDLNGWSLVPIT